VTIYSLLKVDIMHRVVLVLVAIACAGSLTCCQSTTAPDAPSLIRIRYQYGFKNELDTFKGILQKDLVLDGVIKTPFSLTLEEQRTVLDKALAVDFFAWPDTLHREAGVLMSPDPSPDFLRVECRDQEKRLVWFYPLDSRSAFSAPLIELTALIKEIIESRPEYKKLPPARGAHL